MRSVLAEHKQREAAGHKPDFFLLTLAAVKVCVTDPLVTVSNRMRFPLDQTEEQRHAFRITDCIFILCCILDCFVQCETASFQGHIPIFALNFQWQYRHLVRDRAGKIIEGSEVWTTVWGSVC